MIRDTIIKRMKELNLNPNRLSEMLKEEGIPRMTIYDFLTERGNWRDTRTEVVSALMKALGLVYLATFIARLVALSIARKQ